MQSRRRERVRVGFTLAWAALLLLCLVPAVLGAISVDLLFAYDLNDLGKFVHGTQAWLAGGSFYEATRASTIAVGHGLTDVFVNLNPPHFHLLFVPFARLDRGAVFVAWLLTSIGGVAYALHVVRPWMADRGGTALTWSVLALLVAASYPLQFWLMTGQLTFQLLPLVVLAWAAIRRGRWSHAALWLGVATAIKPFFALPLLWVMWRGRGRAWAVGVGTVLAFFGLGVAVAGPEAYGSWIAALGAVDWHGVYGNGSIRAFLERALVDTLPYQPLTVAPGLVRPLELGLFALMGATSLWAAWTDRAEDRNDRAFAQLLLAAILMSPLGWAYYTPWAFLPVLFLATRPTASPALRWLVGASGAALVAATFAPLFGVLDHAALGLTLGSLVFWAHLLAWLGIMADARPVLPASLARLPAQVASASPVLGALGALCAVLAASGLIPSGERHPQVVLFVVMDSLAAQRTSLCGYERPTTPALEILARQGRWSCGLRTAGSWTVPSHATFFTGQGVLEHGVHHSDAGSTALDVGAVQVRIRPLQDSASTLAEQLAARGYRTVGVSANPVVSGPAGLAQGFEVFRSASRFGEWYGSDLVDQVRAALDEAALTEEDDLFLFVNIADAHGPWLDIPADHAWSSEDERVVDLYDYGVSRADATLAHLLETVGERLGRHDAFRIVVTSDHGGTLGEHGRYGHGRPARESLTRVPLVVVGSEDGVALPQEPLSATNLFPIVRDGTLESPLRPALAVAFPGSAHQADLPGSASALPVVARWDGHRKYVWEDGRASTYDLLADPSEQDPKPWRLEDDPLLSVTVEEALEELQGEAVDPDLVERLQAVGYLSEAAP